MKMTGLMMRRFIVGVFGAIGLQFTGGLVNAHHSTGLQFDLAQKVTVKGTVTRLDWRNPHAWLYIDVTNSESEVEAWRIEFSSANRLYAAGWRREDMPVGATVTITGAPARDGSFTIGAQNITLADGRQFFNSAD